MRFASIGDSLSIQPLLQAIANHPDHELTALALAPTLYVALKPVVPALRYCRTWEELLSDPHLDAVVIAADDDETLAAARRMATAGKALLVSPIAGRSATFAYEMTLQHTD